MDRGIKRELAERYEKAMHSMQAGVALLMGYDPSETNPKHLRVGINSAMLESNAIGELLIKKGLITEEEYMIAITEAAEKEADRYQEHLTDITGANVTLI